MVEIRREGCEVVELDVAEHAAFVAAVRPLHAEVRQIYPPELVSLLP